MLPIRNIDFSRSAVNRQVGFLKSNVSNVDYEVGRRGSEATRGRVRALETERYHLPERGEVLVNITDVWGVDFDGLLADLEKEFSWTGADYFTDETDGVVEQWMLLLGATTRSNERPTGTNGLISDLIASARTL